MAATAIECPTLRRGSSTSLFNSKWRASAKNMARIHLLHSAARASQSVDDENRGYKELGLFALRKKIEDAVIRAETLAPTALELEETKRIRGEKLMREYNLWDDPAKSNEILVDLAVTAKVVDALKDLKYKAEEAKLIIELADTDAVNCRLFKQAYKASVDVCKSLDQYEMSKLLKGSFDMQGASLFIRARHNDTFSEIWVEQLLSMYIKWSEKHGHSGRIIEKCSLKNGGVKSATIELEFEYAYGFLLGERGVHRMGSLDGSLLHEPSAAAVDVIPLFLEMGSDLPLDDEDLIISMDTSCVNGHGQIESVVCVEHTPTGVSVQSSGERSRFANEIKALNRLKAKLLVIMSEQGVSSIDSIRREDIVDTWEHDTRNYAFHPHMVAHDLKTGIQLSDLNSVFEGNIELLLGAHINTRLL